VVAGHGVLDPDSSPRQIEETRRYLRDFVASLASTSTAIELYETMLRPLLVSLDHRGTGDGTPLRVSFSDVSVKLVGSNTWMHAQ
jgi:hypothetical protein